MSGLLSSLSMAARALDAQRFGLDVTGQNIANVNTAGYTRRQVILSSVPGDSPLSAGNGVEVDGMRAARDGRLEQRLRQELPAEQRELALAESLALVETAIGAPGESIDAEISAFFGTLSLLATDATSSTARREVALQADALASSFHDMTNRLEAARRDADSGVRDSVKQINLLAERIGKLNAAIGVSPAGESAALHLRDELGEALKSLSALIDIDTIPRADGGMEVSIGNGRPLVIGENAYPLDVVSTPPVGHAAVVSAGVTVTSEITGGRIGGLLHARDSLIPGYLNQLDQLAYAVTQEVNAVHRTGYDLNGVTNRDFFEPLGTAAGAASSIRVIAGILDDPSTIAAGATAAAGDNEIARSLVALRDARVMDGGTATFSDAWGQIVYRVGADSRSARDEQTSRAEIVRQVELLRDRVSGVSLDEEAMMMMKFQRAYEANARFFRAIDQALEILMATLAR